MTKALQGRLNISRPRCVCGIRPRELVELSVGDEASGCVAVEVDIDLADFALALFGRGDVSCAFRFNDSGLVGKRREHKVIAVCVPDSEHTRRAKTVRRAVALYEEDGWQGRDEDAMNHHNRAPGCHNTYNVMYERWV